MSFVGNEIIEITNICETKELEGLNTYGLFYKDILLWTHPYSLNPKHISGYKVSMVDEGETDGIKIIGRVPVINREGDYDYTHYGFWARVKDATEWLSNPKDVTNKEDLSYMFDFFFGNE